MDCETAAECFHEISTQGPCWRDAIGILAGEIQESKVLPESDKVSLLAALEDVQNFDSARDIKKLEGIKGMLMRSDGFAVEYAKIIVDILLEIRGTG